MNESINNLTVPQRAAMFLRVPESGVEWLDDMIRESRKMDKRQPRKPKDIPDSEKFKAFWAAYPKHDGRPYAEKVFAHLAPDDKKLGEIIAGIALWKRSQKWKAGYVWLPSTYLNGRHWESVPYELRNSQPITTGNKEIDKLRTYVFRDYTIPLTPGQEAEMGELMTKHRATYNKMLSEQRQEEEAAQ